MGKTWFGIDNALYSNIASLSSSSSTLNHPVTHLHRPRSGPAWRSGRRPLAFDGANDYLYMAHHADFNITDDLVLYAVFKIDDLSTFRPLMKKMSAGDADGFLLYIDSTGKVVLRTGSSTVTNSVTPEGTITEGNWYFIVAYKTGTTVRVWVNGVEQTVTGAANATIGTNTAQLQIGTHAGTEFSGTIQEIGIASISGVSEWHWPDVDNSGLMKGYWQLDQWETSSTITDQSGNGHHATAVSLSESDNQAEAGVQFIGLDAGSSVDVDTIVLDRRHNLKSDVSVTGARSLWDNHQYHAAIAGVNPVAGEPLVLDVSSLGNNRYWWLQFVVDGGLEYFQIPMVFFGSTSVLERSFLAGFSSGTRRNGVRSAASDGSLTTWMNGEDQQHFEVQFKSHGPDIAILKAVIESSARGYPVVFCPDDDRSRECWFVHVDDPFDIQFNHVYGGVYSVRLSLTEVN